MKRSRFKEEQIVEVLQEQEAGSSTAEACRKHGISSGTFYHGGAARGGKRQFALQKTLRGGCAPCRGCNRQRLGRPLSQGHATLQGRGGGPGARARAPSPDV